MIQQVQKKENLWLFQVDTINVKLNLISTAPGGVVLNKNLLYKTQGTW